MLNPISDCLKPIKAQISRAKTPNSGYILIVCLSIMTLLTSPAWADEIDDILPFVIQVESSGNPNAVSKDGCVGLMQVSPIVLIEYTNVMGGNRLLPYYHYEDLFDPEINVKIGTWYLRRLRDHYLTDKKIQQHLNYMAKKENWLIKDNPPISICGYPCGLGITIFMNDTGNSKWANTTDIKLALILSAYNGGPTRLKKVNYDISKMPEETRDYVRKVMKLYKKAR